jgi:molybdate transport system ATP-binding protein
MDTLRLDLDHALRSFALSLSLTIGRETVALVGPSGAGKSSVLRAVAGLLHPDSGRIALGNDVWFDADRGVDRPPEARSVGLVFQDYALFPHLSVRDNVAFGARGEVDHLLERLHIGRLADVHPGSLSGGEQQRVALARALAREPSVLLLDEPMSALDAHTKSGVRGELYELLRELQLPTLLVTHDFDDASALATRVGVIVEGRILQVGRPDDLVARPADAFVARFTGANLLSGLARPGPGGLTEVVLDGGGVAHSTDPGDGHVGLAVFPWDVTVAHEPAHDSAANHIRAPISSVVVLGNRVRVRIGPITAEVTSESARRLGLRAGDVVIASFKATATRIVPLH